MADDRLRVIQDFLDRKSLKGTLGDLKPNDFEGNPVFTGFCPCDHCDHEVMIECDPDLDDCQCCDEVCT